MNGIKISQQLMVYESYSPQKKSPSEKIGHAAESRDMVAISSQAKDFQAVKQALANVPDIREDKIKQVSAKINSSAYLISAHDIADKIING